MLVLLGTGRTARQCVRHTYDGTSAGFTPEHMDSQSEQGTDTNVLHGERLH